MPKITVNAKPLAEFSLIQIGSDEAVTTAKTALQSYLGIGPGDGTGKMYVGLAREIEALRDCAEAVQEEGVLIRIAADCVYVTGGSGRGTIYAAYEFLERFCGWRFFTEELQTEPQGTVALEDGQYLYNPPFDYRMNLSPYAGEGTDLFLKRHLNAKWGPVPMPRAQGGSVVYATNNAHTFRDLLPDDVYFDSHPEYFAMNEQGKRVRDPNNGTQPCLTNPEVYTIVRDRLREILNAHPEAALASVSQNDGNDFCHCPACTRVNEQEQTSGGTVYRFVNRIARELGPEFPNVMFDTLPYVYSTKPPKDEVLAENVSIRLCLMDTCREHSLPDESCPYNRKMRQFFDDWTAKCGNIYLWDYTANFKNYPISLPNFKLLYQNMQRFRHYPVRGILYQGSHTTYPSIEFGALWTYLQSKLLWEPDMCFSGYLTCIREFLQASYGEGWQYIYDYLVLLMMQPSSDYHYGPAATCEQIIPMLTLPDGKPDMTFIRDANELFDHAEQVTSGKELERVKHTRLHLVWYELCTTYSYIRGHGSAEKIAQLEEKYRTFAKTVGQLERFRINEGGGAFKEYDFDIHPNQYLGG